METTPWDPREQATELNAWRRHQEASLTESGAVLGLISAILAFEVLSVNEDVNTFLVLGVLNLAMIVGWIVVAIRATARADRWGMKVRRIEREVLRVPDRFSLWNEAPEGGLPAWIAVGVVLVGFAVLWFGLTMYAFWVGYLHG
ncbi:MAG TPA: hypothetical protein VEY12_12385 [Thermoplasmata archaeon]|nr:hypothetical protein [Thermoplasmata archaeon]